MNVRHSLIAILALVVMFVAAPFVHAETLKHAGAGIQLNVPDGWHSEQDGDVLHITSGDGTLYVGFWVADEATLAETLTALDTELDDIFHNIKHSGDPTAGEHNGMAFVEVAGTAEVDEDEQDWAKVEEVSFSAAVLMAKKPVILLAFGTAENFANNEDEVDALVNSIALLEQPSAPAVKLQTFKHAASNVKLGVPEGWTATPDGDVLHITSADGTLYIAFYAADEDTLAEVADALDKELDDIFHNVDQDGEETTHDLNGLHAAFAHGTAEVDEDEQGWAKVDKVMWSAGVIMGKKPMIVVAFGKEDSWANNADEITALWESIGPIE